MQLTYILKKGTANFLSLYGSYMQQFIGDGKKSIIIASEPTSNDVVVL